MRPVLCQALATSMPRSAAESLAVISSVVARVSPAIRSRNCSAFGAVGGRHRKLEHDAVGDVESGLLAGVLHGADRVRGVAFGDQVVIQRGVEDHEASGRQRRGHDAVGIGRVRLLHAVDQLVLALLQTRSRRTDLHHRRTGGVHMPGTGLGGLDGELDVLAQGRLPATRALTRNSLMIRSPCSAASSSVHSSTALMLSSDFRISS